jgi:hypothetical protein
MINKPISVMVLSALVLTSCGTVRDSRLNPFNWFGRAQSTPVAETSEEINPLIPRRRASIFRQTRDESYQGWAVQQVSDLRIERRPGGAIITAVGTPDYQGAFEVKLVKVDAESDATTLTYEFAALQPNARTGTLASRQVTAAVWLTDNELAGIRTIRVKAERNVMSSRR